MKRLFTLIVFAGSVIFCQAKQQTVLLQGEQEPTPNYDDYNYGTTASAQFGLSGTTLSITGGNFNYLWGDPITAAVWDGAAGTVGTELFTLSETAVPEGGGLYIGTFSGSGTLTAGQITAYADDDLYVNITTTTQSSPQGEVRGQLIPVPEPATMTLMAVGSVAWLAKRRRKV